MWNNTSMIHYRFAEFETILTSVELDRAEDKKSFKLPSGELERIERLLKRSFEKESGKLDSESEMTEDNPDGCKCSSGMRCVVVRVEGVMPRKNLSLHSMRATHIKQHVHTLQCYVCV